MIVAVVGVFSMVCLCGALFEEKGLTAWMCFASIMANIAVTKQVDMFGLSATLGNVMFASTFLTTDIISERYGAKVSRQAVNICMFFTVAFIAATQSILVFVPNNLDFVNDSMRTLFSITARATTASVAMFYVANVADVVLFEKLKQRFPKALWLRNNVCTILCNCTENFAFTFLAFIGVYSARDCIEIALCTSAIEAVIALCDTPFAYIGRAVCGKLKRSDG